MSLGPEARRAAERALLSLAIDLGDSNKQLGHLHVLTEIELDAGDAARARGWLETAQGLLDRGVGDAGARLHQATLSARAGSGPSVSPDLPQSSSSSLAATEAKQVETQKALAIAQAAERAALSAMQTQPAGAASRPKSSPQAGPLREAVVGDDIPERFRTMDIDVRYLKSQNEGTIGLGTWLLLLGLGLGFAVLSGMGSMQIRENFEVDFNALMTLGLGVACGLAGLALAKHVKRTRDLARRGERYGLFFAPEAMMLRSLGGWTYLPRDVVLGAEVESARSASTNRVAARGWIRYRGAAGETRIEIPEISTHQPAQLETLINRWREGYPLDV